MGSFWFDLRGIVVSNAVAEAKTADY